MQNLLSNLNMSAFKSNDCAPVYNQDNKLNQLAALLKQG